jgi:ubiquinone/menaquinone biosynthesis C-methylase UbiE
MYPVYKKCMMNWHETIEFIRGQSEHQDLVRDAYFDPVLENNVQRFGMSSEFQETHNLIRKYAPQARTILDIGAGNGISSINFALQGYTVTAIEPDTSDTVGANAIRKLAGQYNLNNVTVYESYAEDLKLPDESFDIVYIRQAMHHAYDLNSFIKEGARVLKKNGILLTIRDHVVFNKNDKEFFLETHPLHKFYGGENAFHPNEYKEAFKNAGLTLIEEIKYFESVINYFPQTEESILTLKKDLYKRLKKSLHQKIGIFSKLPFAFALYKIKNGFTKNSDEYFEKMVAGRMYSYVLRK